MATIASGIGVNWPGLNSDIAGLSGWSRKTELDAKYLRVAAAGANADLASSFGAATHGHDSTEHGHTQNSHVHTIAGGARTGTTTALVDVGGASAINTHTHRSTYSNSQTATNQDATITVDSSSNDLLRYEPIIIVSDGSPTGIPDGADAFFVSDSFPASWTRVQGNSYIKGAAAAADGSDVQTGAVTHPHTTTAHNHTQDAHSHLANESSDTGVAPVDAYDPDVNELPSQLHFHTLDLNSKVATNQAASPTSGATNHEPPYRKINIIRNGTGGLSWPDGITAYWFGNHADIPTADGWARLTSFDGSFIKGANADGESNVTTGGTTQHSHTLAHTHIEDAHNHTSTVTSVETNLLSAGTTTVASLAHTHTWTIGSTTATNQNTDPGASNNTSESAFPAYQKIILIKYTSPAVTGSNLRTLLGVGT